MKQLFHRLMVFGLGGLLLVGCKAPTPPPQKTPVKLAVLPTASPSTISEETNEDVMASPDFFSTGNSESLAHYAAGISYALSDKNELATEQFYQAALSDPTNEPLVLEISRSLLAKKQTQKAIDLLEKSAQRPEASAAILIWLAQADFRQGKTNEALSISQAAIKKAPQSVDGYESLFGLFLKTGQTNEVRRLLDQASKKAKSAPDLITLGEMHGVYLRSCAEEASVRAHGIKVLDRAAASKPLPDALLIPLAQAYEHVGEMLKSADIYLKILAADSKPSVKRDAIREKLANIYMNAQDKKRAVEQWQAIVRDNPTHYQAWFALGQLAVEARQLADGAADFQKVLLLEPTMEQAYYELALVQIDLRKIGEALQTLDRAREKFPHTFAGEFFTGLAYTHLKSYDEAVKHLIAAEAIAQATSPKRLNQQFYFQLGAACERNHQIKEAAEYFQKSLQIAPDYDEAMNYLGFMWAERGENLPKARELIEKAVKSEPKNAAYLDSMGWVLFKLNKPAEALPWLLKALEFSEEPDATLLDHQGDVYSELHQFEKARQAWRKSLEIESNETVKNKLDQLPASAR